MPLEHLACEGDGARGDVETIDAITKPKQRDEVAPAATADHEDAILRLQEAIVQRPLPGHEPRQYQRFTPTEVVPGPGDRFPQVLHSKPSRGEKHRGAPGEIQRLRAAWIAEPDLAKQKQIVVELQKRQFEVLPFISFGQVFQPIAYRKNVRGILAGPSIAFWNIEVK